MNGHEIIQFKNGHYHAYRTIGAKSNIIYLKDDLGFKLWVKKGKFRASDDFANHNIYINKDLITHVYRL